MQTASDLAPLPDAKSALPLGAPLDAVDLEHSRLAPLRAIGTALAEEAHWTSPVWVERWRAICAGDLAPIDAAVAYGPRADSAARRVVAAALARGLASWRPGRDHRARLAMRTLGEVAVWLEAPQARSRNLRSNARYDEAARAIARRGTARCVTCGAAVGDREVCRTHEDDVALWGKRTRELATAAELVLPRAYRVAFRTTR